MDRNDDNKYWIWTIVGIFFIAIGLFVVAVKLFAHTPSSLLITIAQWVLGIIVLVLVVVLGLVGIVSLGGLIARKLTEIKEEWSKVNYRLTSVKEELLNKHHELEVKFENQIRALKKARPRVILIFVFLSNVLLILADKSFQDQFEISTLYTIIVSLFLLCVLELGMQLMNKKHQSNKIIGYLIYFLGTISLPLLSMLYHQWTFQGMIQILLGQQLKLLILFGLTALIVLLTPIFLFTLSDD